MQKIIVEKKDKNNFLVNVDGLIFKVHVSDKDYKNLTNEFSKEELVKKSFEFLLKREPKESILKEFDIMVIRKYFPEFPDF
jgi:hypothetical protein